MLIDTYYKLYFWQANIIILITSCAIKEMVFVHNFYFVVTVIITD